jgi:hypothetical protein
VTRSDERELARIKAALTPKEAVLLWMAEAHDHGSIQAYCASLEDAPEHAFPLIRLPQQMEESVRTAMKGQGKQEEEIWQRVRLAVRDVSFLYYLVSQANWRVLQDKRANWLHLALCSTKLTLFTEHEAWERVQIWWDQAREALGNAYVQQGAVQEIARRYLVGHNPLFPEMAQDVDEQVRHAEQLVELYNDRFAAVRSRHRRKQDPVEPGDQPPGGIDFVEVRQAAQPAIQELVALQVDLAKGEALTLIGEWRQGLAQVAPHVWPAATGRSTGTP